MYVQRFREKEVVGEVLLNLDEETVGEVVQPQHAQKLLRHIREL